MEINAEYDERCAMVTALEKLTQLRTDMLTFEKPKPARKYMDEILLLKTKEERKAALDQVPEDIRHIVKFYVADYFAKRQRKPLPDLKP